MVETKPPRPTILYVGESFGQLFDWLQRRADVQVAADLDVAKRWFSELRPLLVILDHSYPGQFPTGTDVEAAQLFPLCRVIHLLREWCDGEMRGDSPSDGMTRIHWHQWRSRFEADWQAWQSSDCPSWGLAATVADEERFATRNSNTAHRNAFAVGIVTACRDSSRGLADAVKAIGFQADAKSILGSDEAAAWSLVLWDEARPPRAAAIPLREVVQRVAPVPVIALASFIRAVDLESAYQAGAVETLAKPFSLHDLTWLLNRHVSTSLSETSADAPAA